MNKNIFKLQLVWWGLEDEDPIFRTSYLNVNSIQGFVMGDKEIINGEEYDTIDIFTDASGSTLTVKFEYHLYNFLKENFMDVAVSDDSQEQESNNSWSHISL